MYANIEDALYDPESVVTLAITDLDTDLPEVACVANRGHNPEVLETALVDFRDRIWT